MFVCLCVCVFARALFCLIICVLRVLDFLVWLLVCTLVRASVRLFVCLVACLCVLVLLFVCLSGRLID